MMLNVTVDKMYQMKLVGMAQAFEDQLSNPVNSSLAFEDRVGLMVDREHTHRENERLQRLLKNARLKYPAASVEGINYLPSRGIDKGHMAALINCSTWITRAQNLLVTGATGTGKTWLACAIGNQACRQGFSTHFQRVPLLYEELQQSRQSGSLLKMLKSFSKFDLLILDDFGVGAVNAQMRSDFLELIECRSGGKSTIVTSQLPVATWHSFLSGGNKTTADAILDRITAGSLRLELSGESMRLVKSIQ